MKISLIAFTERGMALAKKLAAALDGAAVRCPEETSLSDWTRSCFADSDGLVFVGAAGIAVRAVAPFIQSKDCDPAVVAVDECGRYAVPLLSGHLGGANDLARRIASICGAEAVITTATDRSGVFPVDEWARVQGCAIPRPERIKGVSSRLLAGETVTVRSDWSIAGEPPAGVELVTGGAADVTVSCRAEEGTGLCVTPRILTLGVGCRRGVSEDRIEAAFTDFMKRHGYHEAAVVRVCSIDRKADEPGLMAFCEKRRLPFETFSAEALAEAEGDFTASEYVREITGVDNVCERSAVLGSAGGRLVCRKEAADGVTLALAEGAFCPDWRYA